MITNANRNSTALLFIILILLVVAAGYTLPDFAGASTSAAGDTILVTKNTTGTSANGNSYNPVFSSDNQYVAFQSEANNLVTNDSNGQVDVFVHHLPTAATELVSKSTAGDLGNGLSSVPKLSADGRYVVFNSLASNLAANDTNGTWDVFLRDRQTDETEIISKSSDGLIGNGISHGPTVSDDGRFVVFLSDANNLVTNDTNGSEDLFLHDRTADTTVRISADSGGNQTLGAVYPAISRTGDYIVFRSEVNNLVAGDTNGTADIFVYNLQTEAIELVSRHANGTIGNGFSDRPAISYDGRYVVFLSDASNLVDGDTNGLKDVFWHDRQTDQTVRVSVDSSGIQGDNDAVDSFVSVSANGRHAAFTSLATNLVTDDANGLADVFLHDLSDQTTTLISKSTGGVQGNSWSSWVNLSADGQYATFVSSAGNLAAGDENNAVDAFVHEPDIVYQPQLTINYQTGAVGSYFTLTGTGFPPHETAALAVNGTVLGSTPTDLYGGFSLILSTANADEGAYFVTASVNPVATVSFMINAADPVRSQEGTASIFDVPAGIAFDQFIYLPMIVK